MQFQKGQSGNPAGRPRGSRNKASIRLQEMLEQSAEALFELGRADENDDYIIFRWEW